ncbi:MAG: T9SS type A sorting domain-containing protein [Fibrobacteres bacterium]|nr:T9SS type A sorting domain-containing protein [Fibrobacterota bacterium]
MAIKQTVIICILVGLCYIYGQTTISPNPLAGLPSAQGSHIDSIKAMPDNGWLSLGAPAGDPKWGRAYGCAWGGRSIVTAPEIRGAFRTGEGFHAGVKSNGFGQDDYWFYDINSNKWICIYPGTNIKGFNDSVKAGALKADSLGRAVDRTGQPIPGHQFIHAWGGLSYDTDLRKFIMMTGGSFGTYFMPGYPADSEGIALLTAQGMNKSGPIFSPWAYNTSTGRFERELATNGHAATGGFSSSFYVSSLKEYFVGGAEGVSFFNPVTRTWRNVANPGAGPTGYDFSGCVDTKRGRVYLGQTPGNFLYFDLATGKWTKIENPMGYTFNFSSNYASVDYDTINDVILVFDFTTTKSIYVFDPSSNQWVDVIPFPASFKSVMRYTNCAFYDPVLGVFFIYSAGDSQDDGLMWVYKFRDKAVVEKEKTLTSVELATASSTLELYLTAQLNLIQHYQMLPTDTAKGFVGSKLISLTPAKASVTPSGLVRALDTGTASIAVSKNGLSDTLTLTIIESSASTDSLVVRPSALGIFAGDTFRVICTGYFHKGSQTFTRVLDTVALWQSADTSIVTVNKGFLTGKKAGGSLNITVSYDGKSTTASVIVWPKLAYVKRINFQVSATPWKFGWLADNGAAYNATKGYGWLNGAGATRDDRPGTNFLLKSFVDGAAGSRYKVNLPSGRYIVKTGMGDASYGKNSYYWTMFGADTINSKSAGLVNGINIDTITVTGDTGAVFSVKGPINYMAVISDEGVDINAVADDGGLAVNETVGNSGNERFTAGNCVLSVSTLPNPFYSLVNLSVNGLSRAVPVQFEIISPAGQCVIKTVRRNSFVWNGEGFASGSYVVRVSTENKVLIKRIILAH